MLLDADETLVEKKTVRAAPGFDCGDVLSGAAGAVIGAEDGVGAARGVETILDVRGSYRPSVAGLVASDAAAAVRTNIEEEGIFGHVGGAAKVEIGEAAVRVFEFLIGGDEEAETGGGENSTGEKNKADS